MKTYILATIEVIIHTKHKVVTDNLSMLHYNQILNITLLNTLVIL